MPKVNDYIGPYQLITRLGKGSFGEVWLAQPENPKSSPVAVKLSNDPDPDFDALLQEATVWARAGRHPNVVEFLAARMFDQQVVIISEYVPDGSLKDWLNLSGGRAPSVDAAVKMTRGILAGLEHLHAKSIIHRDLKPANILMQGNTPRLADFGLSQVLASTLHASKVAGTRAYMAPEAFDAVRDEKTDLWSIGVLLYQMLAGRMAFPQKDESSLIKAILMTEPQPLPEDVPSWLTQVIEKALSKDPEQRYQSATEMRAALLRSVAQPVQETRKLNEPVKRPKIRQPEPILQPPNRPEPQVEQPTIERGKVIVDLSLKPEPPCELPSQREPKTIPQPKPEPMPARPTGLRPVIKWGGAGLAAILLAVATYLATNTTKSVLPNSLDLPGTAPRLPTISPNSLNSSVSRKSLPDFSEEFAENLNGVKLEMKRVPGGSFLMGSPNAEKDRLVNEGPQHEVTVSDFYIGKYEITQAQWRAVMANNPSYFKGVTLPVETVSWDDAQEFCRKLLKMTGRTYRLPSEAEWEYACRAGSTTPYFFGDDSALLGEYAWYNDNSGRTIYERLENGNFREKYATYKTHPVGTKKPNAWGLYDMYGNVFEWCEDDDHSSYDGNPPLDGSAWIVAGEQRFRYGVLRGGSWNRQDWDEVYRSAARRGCDVDLRLNIHGFRVVLSARTR